MVANAPRQVADFADRAEVQPAPPHERPDRIEEIAAERLITSRYPGPDERRPLPCQRLTFIIADRPFDRQRDRRRFGRWAQPQIDTQHIAIAIARLQQLDDTLGDPHRRLFRLLTGAVRQRFRVEQQDRIDVGRIVKLATALLAQRDRDEAARLLPGVRSAIAARIARSSAASAKSVKACVTAVRSSAPARSPIATDSASARRSNRNCRATGISEWALVNPRSICPAANRSASTGSRSSNSDRKGACTRARWMASVKSGPKPGASRHILRERPVSFARNNSRIRPLERL